MNNNIPYFYPAFQGENFKQCQHSISHIVEIKVPRIRPESQNRNVLWNSDKKHPKASIYNSFQSWAQYCIYHLGDGLYGDSFDKS